METKCLGVRVLTEVSGCAKGLGGGEWVEYLIGDGVKILGCGCAKGCVGDGGCVGRSFFLVGIVGCCIIVGRRCVQLL